MHLVYKALEKYAIPSILPTELLPPAKRKSSGLTNSPVPILPVLPSGVTSNLVNKQPPMVNFESIKNLYITRTINYVLNHFFKFFTLN